MVRLLSGLYFEKNLVDFQTTGIINFKGRNDKIKDGLISGYKLNEGKNLLQLIKTGQGRLFYTVRFKYDT